MYDLSSLEAELTGTIFAGKLHFSPTTDSTNSDAMSAARAGAPHGSFYLADEQTAGRGRGDHGWLSAAGEGLYFSVVLRLPIPVVRMPLLPLAAGLAAADAIAASVGLVVDLRWPNDLLIGSRKTGGILVETQSEFSADRAPFAVTGIGINVHQSEFPPGLATPATSLDLEAGHRISRQTVLVALLKSLEREASALADPAEVNAVFKRMEQASTWIRGRSVQVHGPQACQGITAGLDENGFLRVTTVAGVVTVQTGGLRAAKES